MKRVSKFTWLENGVPCSQFASETQLATFLFQVTDLNATPMQAFQNVTGFVYNDGWTNIKLVTEYLIME